jgi:NAD(P)H dehydrogenase (quinone)
VKRILVVYSSKTGNTKRMAEAVAEGVRETGCEALLQPVGETTPDDLLGCDGVIAGSPTYFGLAAWDLKKLFDDSVVHYRKLEGKPGGAFSSSGILGGGNETTVMSILAMMLVHGMVVCGTTSGAHYGPVSVGRPDDAAKRQCRALGKRVADLALKL